jgi:predicted transcriptional regulator
LTLEEISRIIECEVVTGDKYLSHNFETVCAADLMSEVLALAKPGEVLLTGLRNVQSVHTANVAEVRAIIYVRGKIPDDPAVRLAEQKRIPLLSTRLSMFEACGRLYQSGLRSGTDIGEK